MHNVFKQYTILLIILALIAVPFSSMAASEMETDDQVEVGKMTADALLVRPLGIVATVLGFGLFVVSVPFSALGGNTKDAWQAMVVKPAKFTFKRPLGDLD